MSEKMAQNANQGSSTAGGPVAAPAAPARAKTVGIAFWLLVAAAAAVLIRIPVGISAVNSDEYKAELEAVFGRNVIVPNWIASESSAYVWSGIITAAVFAAIAVLIRMGLGWPRFVLVLSVVLTGLNMRVQFTQEPVVTAAAWVTLASVLLALAAAVLLFLPQSGAYFKSVSRGRKNKLASQA
ncbi:hypothetical protein OL239_18955 [Arthrobacter sp. ATA002]|uniref:hypothetical protein n=1 Tax=Arthrobacter sp. ATA002 TaxID=2991715 RepID=UPI0022A7B898|nr:hypothetical protein [Arthrobacter sp. ATA002]WAP51778.1 hypothetical protein OL239_18955 [Arthrobacter sp. ATA002]